MLQVIETSDKEKFEMYSLLEKDVLIGMLIECNKHLQRLTPTVIYNKCFYTPSNDTSMRCIHCGKQKHEH
jgi:hypothetical protein